LIKFIFYIDESRTYRSQNYLNIVFKFIKYILLFWWS